MTELKLSRLPDRVPVKLTISISPDLHRALGDYSAVYMEAYGEAAPVHELIPAILASFLDSDREFARRRRELVR